VSSIARVPVTRCKRNVLSVLDLIAGRSVVYELLSVP
jgi:hypothetical protein